MSGVVAPVSNDRIQRHVPGLGFELWDTLKLVGDADEFRSSPASLRLQMMKPAVIEARAAAESRTAAVDRDERHKHQVEFPNGDAWRLVSIGLKDAERIRSQPRVRVEAHELHAVVTTMSDCRQVDAAAAALRQCDDVGKIHLTSLTDVYGHTTARTQQAQAIHHSRQADRDRRLLRIGNGASQRPHLASQLIPILRCACRGDLLRMRLRGRQGGNPGGSLA